MPRRRVFSPLDAVLLALVAGAVIFTIYRITVKLDYAWNWSVLPQFLFRHDEEQGWVANYLVKGLLTTLRLSIWAGLLALVLGLLMALARTGTSLFWRLWALGYVELMRNLPPLVIIFLFYFFLADQVVPYLGLDTLVAHASPDGQRLLAILFDAPETMPAFLAAVITLAVFESAYIAEIFRAGIESIGRPQWEAAYALGLSRAQCLRRIILPQAVRRVLPPMAGQFISLIKDSAIVSVISIQELTYQGTQLMASTYLTIEVWLTIAAMYFFLTFPCSMAVARLEVRFNRRE
jgi:polar amino acid transport system permease protein